MSNAAYNRGSKVIRAAIDQSVTRAISTGALCPSCTGKDNLITILKNRLETARATLAAEHEQHAATTAALVALQNDMRQLADLQATTNGLLLQTQDTLTTNEAARATLSRIIRAEMSPEQYHVARQREGGE